MPRKNIATHGRRHRNVARTAAPVQAAIRARDGFAALAESLVDRGLASSAILDNPSTPLDPTERQNRP